MSYLERMIRVSDRIVPRLSSVGCTERERRGVKDCLGSSKLAVSTTYSYPRMRTW